MFDTQKSKANQRRCGGQHAIELCCALIFIVPLLLFFFDIAYLFVVGETNKSVCRDAARAAADVIPAAFGAPGTDPAPRFVSGNDPNFKRAQAVVERLRANRQKNWMAGITLNAVSVDLGRVPSAQATALGGPIPGNVTVATSVNAQVPAPFPGFSTFKLNNQFTFELTAFRPTTIIPNEAAPVPFSAKGF